VEEPAETRFIQSFKSFAAAESFSETQIMGRRFRFEDLLSTFLLKLRAYAEAGMAQLPDRVIVGRPVTFAGGAPTEALALSRYEIAFKRMGFREILYAYEPVGAAFFFARDLDHDATVLVGDFGGGTSDFSIIRFERLGGEIFSHPLGRSGVGVAGDAFDYQPTFGDNSYLRGGREGRQGSNRLRAQARSAGKPATPAQPPGTGQ
jgi:hypothetical chaperone protein